MKKEMFLVVAYDIVSDKRRNKLIKLLKDYNGQRVNFSVFECRITKKSFISLQTKIKEMINKKEDCVLFYDLCLTCEQKRRSLGLGAGGYKQSLIVNV
jgi:CRISPR-associated protein Cas2